MTKQRVNEATSVIITLLLVTPFVISAMSLMGLAVIAGLRSMSVTVPLAGVVFFDAPHFAVANLFADVSRYLIFSSLALISLLGSLIVLAARSRRGLVRRPQFYLIACGILSLLGFAWFPSYQPAVQPASGVQLQIVEQPAFIAAVVRRNQVSAEIEGCSFEALGWADANTLVYRKWCGGFFDPSNNYAWKDGTPTAPRAYRIDAKTDQAYSGDLTLLARNTCAYFNCVLPLLDKNTVQISTHHLHYPNDSYDGVRSPDGQWVAFRAKHVYGPEDLLVIGVPGS